MVLAALIEKPFEPLRQDTPRNLTLKVLFLFAATTTHRVSEIHALCIDPPFLIQNPQSFRLEVALSLNLEITTFYPEPTNALEWAFHLMCPVHDLHIYLRRTEHSRGPNRSLFVYWDEGRTHRPVSKQWISSSLMEALRSAYCHKGHEHEIVSANPHLIQGMATSWAEIARVPTSGNLSWGYLVWPVHLCPILQVGLFRRWFWGRRS